MKKIIDRERKKTKKREDGSSLLGSLFGSTRQFVLSLLYSHADESFHLRKVIKLAGGNPGAIQRELKNLAKSGLILRTVKDNQVHFQANPRCPIFNELKSIIMKTAGMADVIRGALAPLNQSIKAAVIFGSIARGAENMESDVDLLVIGEVKFSDIVEKINPAQTLLNREINPVVMSIDEFEKRVREKEHFISAILEKPVISVIGEVSELIGLA